MNWTAREAAAVIDCSNQRRHCTAGRLTWVSREQCQLKCSGVIAIILKETISCKRELQLEPLGQIGQFRTCKMESKNRPYCSLARSDIRGLKMKCSSVMLIAFVADYNVRAGMYRMRSSSY